MGEKITSVTSSVLMWARRSANISLEEAKGKFPKIEQWEKAEDYPTFSQLESISDFYKRPIALFFFPEPPEENLSVEFRTLPDFNLELYEKDIILKIRNAKAYQTTLIELFGGENPSRNPLWKKLKVTLKSDVSEIAQKLRQMVNIDNAESLDDDSFLKKLRFEFEEHGFFIFKNSFKERKYSGFCLWHEEFPIIMLNNSTSKTRQIFSLLHEVAHVLLNQSAISKFELSKSKVEVFCNAFAAEFLVPTEMLLQNNNIANNEIFMFSDNNFSDIAKEFHVSKETILRRFLNLRLVSKDFYVHKAKIWNEEYLSLPKIEGGGGNYYATQNTYLSLKFLSEIIARKNKNIISVSDASTYLGINAKNFDGLETAFFKGYAT